MKTLLTFTLIASLLLSGCMPMNATTSSGTQQGSGYGTEFAIAAIGAVAISAIIYGAQAQKHQADETKFKECVGKTKAEVYAIYGPPNSIVDDGLADGGTILEYTQVASSGGSDDTPVTTITIRKLFYLNKDNIVTSVKEDSH